MPSKYESIILCLLLFFNRYFFLFNLKTWVGTCSCGVYGSCTLICNLCMDSLRENIHTWYASLTTWLYLKHAYKFDSMTLKARHLFYLLQRWINLMNSSTCLFLFVLPMIEACSAFDISTSLYIMDLYLPHASYRVPILPWKNTTIVVLSLWTCYEEITFQGTSPLMYSNWSPFVFVNQGSISFLFRLMSVETTLWILLLRGSSAPSVPENS